MSFFDRILDSEYLEYIAAVLFLTAWWVINKTRHTIRRLQGIGGAEDVGEPAAERPRRRLPLY